MINKLKYLVFTLLCLCVTPLVTHAECDYQRTADLSRIANNVQFSYTYDLSEGLTFTIYVTNLTNDIYVVDAYGNRFSGVGEKSLVYSSSDVIGFQNGDQVAFTFYSNDNNCKGTEITTKYVNFPQYNGYSRLEACQQHPDFRYCQMWMDTSYLTYDQFEKDLNEFIANKKVTFETPKGNVYNNIFEFLSQPLVMGVGLFLLAILIISVIFMLIKKWHKKR